LSQGGGSKEARNESEKKPLVARKIVKMIGMETLNNKVIGNFISSIRRVGTQKFDIG
jgi:hypothetical protein